MVSAGKLKESKKLLESIRQCPFDAVKKKCAPILSLTRLKLNHTKAALKTTKSGSSNISFIQDAIVFGENGKLSKVNSALSFVVMPQKNEMKVISLIKRRYNISSEVGQAVSRENLIDQQLHLMLLAA
jgi:hypothetical protein